MNDRKPTKRQAPTARGRGGATRSSSHSHTSRATSPHPSRGARTSHAERGVSRELRGSREDHSNRNRMHPARTTRAQTMTQKRTGAAREYSNSRARRAASATKPRAAFLKPVIGIVAILLLLSMLRLVLCSSQDRQWAESMAQQSKVRVTTGLDSSTDLYHSPFSWSNLVKNGDRYSYVVNGETLSRLGVDVSEHNASIDWSKVAADGIEFAYIRAGYRGTVEGNIAPDATFDVNLSGAQAAGLDVGVYFYSQAINEDEAAEEAGFVIRRLNGTPTTYPIAFDLEPGASGTDRVSSLSQDQLTKVAAAFCRTCEAGGYHAVVYGSQVDLAHYNLEDLTSYGFWYAEYESHPTMGLNFALWQYSSKGSVDGINGKVDLDLDLTPVTTAKKSQ